MNLRRLAEPYYVRELKLCGLAISEPESKVDYTTFPPRLLSLSSSSRHSSAQFRRSRMPDGWCRSKKTHVQRRSCDELRYLGFVVKMRDEVFEGVVLQVEVRITHDDVDGIGVHSIGQ